MMAKQQHILLVLILSLMAVVAFGKTYQNEFLGIDDHVYIYDNPYIRDGLTPEGISWAFRAGLTELDGFVDYWQPMTFLSRMVDISLFKFRAGMHHLTNLFFHMLNIVLLYAFLWRASKRAYLSFFVAAMFAVHPLQSEILGWVTARKDTLSLFFGLITIHAYLNAKQSPSVFKNILLAFCFALSLMSKPMMISLPVLLLLIDAWQMDIQKEPWTWKKWFPLLINKWPLFVMIMLYIPVPFLGQPRALEFDLNHPAVRAITAYSFYIGKLLWPAHLSLYGPLPPTVIPLSKALLSGVFLCALTGLLGWLSRYNKLILLGWLWFLMACLPIISLPVADRFMYMPMIGFWLAALSLLELAVKNQTVLRGILIAVLMCFSVLSFQQIAVWKNNETVLHRALEFSNDNFSAHNVLGAVYGKRKEFDLAMKHLKEAIRIKPDRDKPYNNVGMILELQGDLDGALEYYEKSLSLKPDDFRTISNIGIIYIRQGNTAKGIEYFERALKLSPKVRGLQNNLMIAYYKEGNVAKAEELAEQFRSPYAFNQFGIFKIQQRDYPAARRYFNRALAIDPSYHESAKNLKYLDEVLGNQE